MVLRNLEGLALLGQILDKVNNSILGYAVLLNLLTSCAGEICVGTVRGDVLGYKLTLTVNKAHYLCLVDEESETSSQLNRRFCGNVATDVHCQCQQYITEGFG